MDIRNLSKIKCSRYTDLDEKVIAKASELGMPLIGGTALEVIANEMNVPGVRKRSNNDLDFLSTDRFKITEFKKWLFKNIDPDKVQVDIYVDAPKNYKHYIMSIDGILVMRPTYLIWSKLTRGSEKDLRDIKWLLTIDQVSDGEISAAMEDLGLTEKEIELLLSLAEG